MSIKSAYKNGIKAVVSRSRTQIIVTIKDQNPDSQGKQVYRFPTRVGFLRAVDSAIHLTQQIKPTWIPVLKNLRSKVEKQAME